MLLMKILTTKAFLLCFIIAYKFLKPTFCEEYPELTTVDDTTDSTTTCISRILEHNFECGQYITFIDDRSFVSKLIKSISERNCYSFIVKTLPKKNWLIFNKIYLIVSTGVYHIKKTISQLKSETFWNPRAWFLVSAQNCTDAEIKEIFNLFLSYKIYDMIFLVEDNSYTSVYTYFPFEYGKCGNDAAAVNVGNCQDVANNTVYFQRNVIKSFNKCKFKAEKFSERHNITILEQHVLDSFANYTNFSLVYEELHADKNFGVVLPNGTTTGLLGYLQRNEADIIMGSTVLIQNRANLYEFITGFNFASFQLYSSAEEDERWKSVYIEFDGETWSLIILLYCLMIIVCILVLNLSPKISYNPVYLMVSLYGYFLVNGVEPFAKSKRLRRVMISWIWFTFLMSSFYNSDMYSLVTGHMTYKRQISHEKLSTIPYKPCISTVIRTFFFFAYNENLPASIDKPSCKTIEGALDTVASSKDLYTVQLKSTYTSREKDFISASGKRKLDSWDFSNDIILCFYVYKGFVLKDPLQMYAYRMFETGLIKMYNMMIIPERTVDVRNKKTFKQFLIGDFRIHFGVLFVGYIMSSTVFMLEKYIYKKKTK